MPTCSWEQAARSLAYGSSARRPRCLRLFSSCRQGRASTRSTSTRRSAALPSVHAPVGSSYFPVRKHRRLPRSRRSGASIRARRSFPFVFSVRAGLRAQRPVGPPYHLGGIPVRHVAGRSPVPPGGLAKTQARSHIGPLSAREGSVQSAGRAVPTFILAVLP